MTSRLPTEASTRPPSPAAHAALRCGLARPGFAADDQLYVETSKGTCNQYLAVELDTVILSTGGVASSCGGRAPSYDVIDVSYSALAAFPGRNLENYGGCRERTHGGYQITTPTPTTLVLLSSVFCDEGSHAIPRLPRSIVLALYAEILRPKLRASG